MQHTAGMMGVAVEYPVWANVRPCIPSRPCVFSAVSPLVVREYEAELLRNLPWPSSTTPSQKATCVRVMASQLLPLVQEYVQIRDHLQDYLAKLDRWHTQYLIRHLTQMQDTLELLKEDMQKLKLQAHVQRQPSVAPSAAPSIISSTQLSVADSIKEARRAASALRGQGPATVFASPEHPGPGGPTQVPEVTTAPTLVFDATMAPVQFYQGPQQGQVGPMMQGSQVYVPPAADTEYTGELFLDLDHAEALVAAGLPDDGSKLSEAFLDARRGQGAICWPPP